MNFDQESVQKPHLEEVKYKNTTNVELSTKIVIRDLDTGECFKCVRLEESGKVM